ncbi:hypothetical protein CCYA_CCYA13G3531 [Cyanidiococcus yangmingshanensis]|nr:hypothetical protein CCYA_CCYA13G3531 [Cyanidiococcus yangmingshanensis]
MEQSDERPPLMRPGATRCDDITRQIAGWTGLCWLLAGWPLARIYYRLEPVPRWKTAQFAVLTGAVAAASAAWWVQRTEPACSAANRAVYGSRR